MALVFMDGFGTLADDVSDTDLTLAGWRLSGAMLVANTSARFAGTRYVETGSAAQVRKTLPATTNNISVGFAFRSTGLGGASGTSIFELQDSGDGLVVAIGLDSAGAYRVGRADFTTNNICTTAAAAYVANTWSYVEIEVVRSATVGTVNLYVNGILAASATGANTGASAFGVISLRGNILGQYTDIYVCNTATEHKGDCRIETLVPNADTAQRDWARSTGSTNFSLVDELPENVDTDYVSDATVGHKDLYDCTNLSSTPLNIYGVMTEMFARKDDAVARQVRLDLKSGATTAVGATATMAATYIIQRDLYLTDPNTSAAWTAAAVNAAQIGPEVVT